MFEVLQNEIKSDQIKPDGSQPSDLGTHFASICGLGQFFLILPTTKHCNFCISNDDDADRG